MGGLSTKHEELNAPKYDKYHRKRKMFSMGIGIERGDLIINAHTQIGYVSATIKKYEKNINDENPSVANANVDEPGVLPAPPDNG
jgi:hypothetical protein